MKRFYKATDGRITVYRATERTYASVSFTSIHLPTSTYTPAGWYVGTGGISFSAKHAVEGYRHAVEEIVQSEYETLIALRNTWLQSRGIDPKDRTSPQSSWLPNAMIDGANRMAGKALRFADDLSNEDHDNLQEFHSTNPR